MRNYRIISFILILLLLISVGFIFKQNNQSNKIENALYNVAISNTITDYRMSSFNNTLNGMMSDKNSYIIHDNYLGRDFYKLSRTYNELYGYYLMINANNIEVSNNLTGILEDFSTFFNYLFDVNDDGTIKEDKDQYHIFQNEAHEGIEIIATMVRSLEEIRSEVYKDKPTDDRQAWETLVIKNEEYAQSAEAQQNLEKIQQIIKTWVEKVNPS